MADDRVTLVFIGDGVQLVRLPPGNPGRLVPCGRGWAEEMSRGAAERVKNSRPDFFEIREVLQEATND